MTRFFDLILSSIFFVSGCVTLLLAIAAHEAQKDTPDALDRAILLTPWNADYRQRAAFIHGREGRLADERRELEEVLRLEPTRSSAMLDLANAAERDNDYEAAERWLLRANEFDRQMPPAWALANFYLRRGDEAKFWIWLRSALQRATQNVDAIWQVAYRVKADAAYILDRLGPVDPKRVREFLAYVRKQNDFRNAVVLLSRIEERRPEDRESLLWICDGYLRLHEISRASAMWQAVAGVTSDGNLLSNASFAAKPTGQCLDWRLPASHDVTTLASESGLHIVLNGKQGMDLVLAEQVVSVPARPLELTWKATMTGPAPAPGTAAEIADFRSGALLGFAPIEASVMKVASGSDAVIVRVVYRRPKGSMRTEAEVQIRDLKLRSL